MDPTEILNTRLIGHLSALGGRNLKNVSFLTGVEKKTFKSCTKIIQSTFLKQKVSFLR